MLRLTNIRIPVGESEESLRQRCAQTLRLSPGEIQSLRILRKSLDVRNKSRLEHVYTAAVTLEDERRALARARGQVSVYEPVDYQYPRPGAEPLRHRPVIVGAGPAGLFAAYQLAELGYAPIVLERGKIVRDRTKDVRAFDEGGPLDAESNYLFGEGGAGTFSDGKLTCRNTGADTDRALAIMAECKGKPSILYEAKPHLGSNRLPAVVKAVRRRVIEMGGEFRFQCRLDRLVTDADGRSRLETSLGPLEADVVILAIGHSARDTIEMLHQSGLAMEFKAFQMGVRIEQPQGFVNRSQYGTGPQAACLGAADYTMNVHAVDREVFSFCMCAGGYVMPSVSQEGYFCTNGMSRSFHESPYANSGIVVTVTREELEAQGFGSDPLAGIRYQSHIERAGFEESGGSYHAPIQWAHDFVEGRRSEGAIPSTYRRGVHATDLARFLPAPIVNVLRAGLRSMDHAWRGDFLRDATLVGPEARGSCPIRMTRDPDTRLALGKAGVYPIGEGAGYAGGIVSAAVDGLRTARAVINRYSPPGR